MSHVVTIQTEVRDTAAVQAACARLGLPPACEGRFELYAAEASGLGVALQGWRYPLVCQPTTGELRYDIFNGAWGDRAELDRFLQAYAVEKVRSEARRRGLCVVERPLADGHVHLTLSAGGAA